MCLSDEKSKLVQVMAWCHQTTSHYLGQCWSRSMLPYSLTKPQWVKSSQPWTRSISVSRNGLSPVAPSYNLNQCRLVVNWTFGNKLQLNFNQNAIIFIWYAFENIVFRMWAILFVTQYVIQYMAYVACFASRVTDRHRIINHCGLVMPYGDIELGQHRFR